MKRRSVLCQLAVLILLASAANLSFAIEPWADDKLPVKDGLELWLSAAQENRARAAGNPPASIPPGGQLDLWHDGSGKKHHVRQAAEIMRPRLFHLPSPTVRFDGNDDFLSAAGMESSLNDTTIFVRATPRSNKGFFRAFLSFNKSGQND